MSVPLGSDDPEDRPRGRYACDAAACHRPATRLVWRGGVVLYAACEEHDKVAHPVVPFQGAQLPVVAYTLVDIIEAAIDFRCALADHDISADLRDLIALQVLQQISDSPATRDLVRAFLDTRNG